MADGSHIAGLGHNQPPSPFEAVKVHCDDLLAEARHWLDGKPVTTQEEANGISLLMDNLRKAKTATDNARKEAGEPHRLKWVAENERYRPLIESTDRAVAICKQALQPFLVAQEAARQAAAAEARRVAEEAARIAAETARAASRGDLEQQEDANTSLKAAKEAEKVAKALDKSRTHATGGARATTLRTVYVAKLTNEYEAAKWAWEFHRPEMLEAIEGLAKQRVAGGVRQIAGFEITAGARVV